MVTSLRRVPLGLRLIRPLVTRLLPDEPTAVTLRSGVGAGLRLVIDPQTEKFLWAGDHEVAVQHELAATLRPGMVFWDEGAHAGFFSIAGRLVGERGWVHAFEPMPLSRRIAHMIVEFTNETVLDQVRRLLPLHEFRQLDDRHWVLR